MYVIRDTTSGYYFRTCSDLGYDYWTTKLAKAKQFDSFSDALDFIAANLANHSATPERL